MDSQGSGSSGSRSTRPGGGQYLLPGLQPAIFLYHYMKKIKILSLRSLLTLELILKNFHEINHVMM